MDVEIWPVMKWVLLILLAGFIGHFGKMMAQYTMRKAAKSKEAATAATGPSPDIFRKDGEAVLHPADKGEVASVKALPIPAGMDKKLLKTLAKQEKKKIKAIKNAGS